MVLQAVALVGAGLPTILIFAVPLFFALSLVQFEPSAEGRMQLLKAAMWNLVNSGVWGLLFLLPGMLYGPTANPWTVLIVLFNDCVSVALSIAIRRRLSRSGG